MTSGCKMGAKYVVIFASVISVAQMMVDPRNNISATEITNAMDVLLENTTTVTSNKSTSQDLYGHLTDEFLSCIKMKLSPDDYKILDNDTLYVYVYANTSWRVLFEYGNYFILETEEALICYYPTYSRTEPFNDIQAYMTVIGLSVSLFCLLLHFITFLLVPEMKNLPGKNLASLTVALFFAYLLFLVGNMRFYLTPACYIIGIFIYYFMMASFFWMSAISFDIFKSVRMATNKLRRLSRSQEQRWFIVYSTYSWAVPAIFTAVVIAGDLLPFLPYDFRPKFGDHHCWFRHRLAIIVFFASPLGVLMFGNAVFFVMSTKIILSNSFKKEESAKKLKKSLTLNLKLAVIMGLVWITDIVAGIIDNDYVWYIFLSLTVLQGMFIFIAFTRFKKTGSHLKQRMNSMVTTIHGSAFFSSSTNIHSTRSGSTS